MYEILDFRLILCWAQSLKIKVDRWWYCFVLTKSDRLDVASNHHHKVIPTLKKVSVVMFQIYWSSCTLLSNPCGEYAFIPVSHFADQIIIVMIFSSLYSTIWQLECPFLCRLVIHEKSHSSSCSQGSQIDDISVESCLSIAKDSQALNPLNLSNCGLWAPLCNIKRGYGL
jgi:hypothetical protein